MQKDNNHQVFPAALSPAAFISPEKALFAIDNFTVRNIIVIDATVAHATIEEITIMEKQT